MGLQGGNFGLWNYTLFEIWIMDLKSNQSGIFYPCKLESRDYVGFEIGITGLLDPTMRALEHLLGIICRLLRDEVKTG